MSILLIVALVNIIVVCYRLVALIESGYGTVEYLTPLTTMREHFWLLWLVMMEIYQWVPRPLLVVVVVVVVNYGH
jgi:hypothetical protein